MIPLCRQSTLTASLLFASAVLASAAPQLLRPAAKTGLVQAEEAGQPFASTAMDVQWFAEDAQRKAQMPPYIPSPKKNKKCNPICHYTCGKSECDQNCEPVCLPPQCETLCTKSEDKCETRCNKPKCAVICPLDHECTMDHGCPKAKCRTICAPPVCTTSCSDSCHSVCSQPQCNWKCKPGNCPKPECKMECPGLGKCKWAFPHANSTKVPIMPGMKTV